MGKADVIHLANLAEEFEAGMVEETRISGKPFEYEGICDEAEGGRKNSREYRILLAASGATTLPLWERLTMLLRDSWKDER